MATFPQRESPRFGGFEHDSQRICSNKLRELLLGFFQMARVLPIPGADGLTLDDAVDCYELGVAAGLLPSWESLLLNYPDLADDIRSLLSTRNRLESSCMTPPT